jgi:hypothetical protein
VRSRASFGTDNTFSPRYYPSGLVAGCGILGSPLNVHYSNYIRHVGLVLAVPRPQNK